MHLIIPFAAPMSEPARQALRTLALPHLRGLLAQWPAPECDAGDEWSLSPPHERAWARSLGWGALPDGLFPLAALRATQHHGDAAALQHGWGLLAPAHWRLGTEQVSLMDPADLNLSAEESRAFFNAVRELFESEGFQMSWLEPTAWLCRHDALADLPTASLDRVIGRNVDRWLGADTRARLLRRLQNEAQMLLHSHALNEEREARGALALNSVWLSGTGPLPAAQPADKPPASGAVTLETSLRAAALADDATAWAAAFERLDTGPVAQWAATHGQNPAASLTLCGERSALTWRPARLGAGARLKRALGLQPAADWHALLQDL